MKTLDLKKTRFMLIYHTSMGAVSVTETKHQKRRDSVLVVFSNLTFGEPFEIVKTELRAFSIIDGEEQFIQIELPDADERDAPWRGNFGILKEFNIPALEEAFRATGSPVKA